MDPQQGSIAMLYLLLLFLCHEHLHWARTARLGNKPTPPKLRLSTAHYRKKEIFTTSDGEKTEWYTGEVGDWFEEFVFGGIIGRKVVAPDKGVSLVTKCHWS
jgi:hypothetical protein